jgi:hypothetical protein
MTYIISSYDKLPNPGSQVHRVITALEEQQVVDFSKAEWKNVNIRQAITALRHRYNFVIVCAGENYRYMWKTVDAVPPEKIISKQQRAIISLLAETPNEWVDITQLKYSTTQLALAVGRLKRKYNLDIVNNYGIKEKKQYKLIGDTRNNQAMFMPYRGSKNNPSRILY